MLQVVRYFRLRGPAAFLLAGLAIQTAQNISQLALHVSSTHPPPSVSYSLSELSTSKLQLLLHTFLSTMVSNKQIAADWVSQQAFVHFTEICSVRRHPALAHAPSLLPTAKWFLQTSIEHGVWNGSNLRPGVQDLALKLDRDWPEWAANATNVLGVILHPMFAESGFFPSLEALPAHETSITTCIRFEKLLYLEAQARHTWEWRQMNYKSKPYTCYCTSRSQSGKTKPECAGHPINGKSRRTYSWRGYYEVVAKEKGRMNRMMEWRMTEDDWVLL